MNWMLGLALLIAVAGVALGAYGIRTARKARQLVFRHEAFVIREVDQIAKRLGAAESQARSAAKLAATVARSTPEILKSVMEHYPVKHPEAPHVP